MESIFGLESLGPNLQTRLEALEAAMGVRLNLAKAQGRHSLSNSKSRCGWHSFDRSVLCSASSSSPMQVSPSSTVSTMTPTSTPNSLSLSSRHNIPVRAGQGVQRSASSCDAENRPGPIKRLKPSSPPETSPSSTVAAIATIKKYPPPVRRPLIMTTMTTTPTPTQSTPTKQRLSPMDTSSPRLSRSSTTSNNSSNYRTPIGSSPKASNSPSPKQTNLNSPSRLPRTLPRKQRFSMFGEQFSDDILKTNLFWIDQKELDEESRMEVLLQFGSVENYLREQQTFFRKQQLKLSARNKTVNHRSRFPLIIPKKDRLELL